MFVVDGMSMHDVNLRCAGAFVLVNGEPVYVREMYGADRTGDNEYKVQVQGAYIGADETRQEIKVNHIDFGAPSTGYCTTESCVYVTRAPERQSRTGLPAHSTMVRRSIGDGLTRLGVLRWKDQMRIVTSMYGNRGHVPLREAMSKAAGTVSSVTDRFAVHVRPSGGEVDLLGPDFTVLGTATIAGDTVTVRTKHPHAISALLGDMYG